MNQLDTFRKAERDAVSPADLPILDTLQIVEMIAQKYGGLSDYAVAGKLQVTRQTLSRYRNKRGGMSDEIGRNAALLLELPVGYVLGCLAAERATTDLVRSEYQDLARLAKVFAEKGKSFGFAIICAGLLYAANPLTDQGTASAQVAEQSIHYTHILAALVLAAFLRANSRYFLHARSRVQRDE